ncbi:hypothetical protein QTO34_009905 [Cnephaeus nilssonii]|uniref:Uncharacterized protein n=1 Tax=Cnephaeus nilssonii TaxID=3371016 RepID=A0AA40HED8_CNENI|nr:hypothetical protein QTO34_009905 [Eptesicus nilssonii]
MSGPQQQVSHPHVYTMGNPIWMGEAGLVLVVFGRLLGSSDGLQGSPSLNCALFPLHSPPGCILGLSLAVSSLKYQHPEHHHDQSSHAHLDEIPHGIVFGVGGWEFGKMPHFSDDDFYTVPHHPAPQQEQQSWELNQG